MTEFEYLMVMVSVIMALALAQLLRGATEIITNPNRYWVHSTWVAVAVLLIIQFWWGFWDFHALSNWTLVAFMFVLLMPILAFLIAHLLIPTYREKDTDWAAHFYKIRLSFFVTMIGLSLIATFSTWIFFEISLLHPYRLFQVLQIGLLIAGFVSNRRKLHEPLVVIYISIFVMGQLVVRMDIGALAGN